MADALDLLITAERNATGAVQHLTAAAHMLDEADTCELVRAAIAQLTVAIADARGAHNLLRLRATDEPDEAAHTDLRAKVGGLLSDAKAGEADNA